MKKYDSELQLYYLQSIYLHEKNKIKYEGGYLKKKKNKFKYEGDQDQELCITLKECNNETNFFLHSLISKRSSLMNKLDAAK